MVYHVAGCQTPLTQSARGCSARVSYSTGTIRQCASHHTVFAIKDVIKKLNPSQKLRKFSSQSYSTSSVITISVGFGTCCKVSQIRTCYVVQMLGPDPVLTLIGLRNWHAICAVRHTPIARRANGRKCQAKFFLVAFQVAHRVPENAIHATTISKKKLASTRKKAQFLESQILTRQLQLTLKCRISLHISAAGKMSLLLNSDPIGSWVYQPFQTIFAFHTGQSWQWTLSGGPQW